MSRTDRNYKKELMDMIDRLLAGDWTVEQFDRAYYDFELEEVPRESLSEDEDDFFSTVREKLDWTTPSPTEYEREHGWLTHEEFVDWVRLEQIRFMS